MTKAQLLSYIDTDITTNGNNEITGEILNNVLTEMVNSMFGAPKKIVMTVTQSGVDNAPTMTILENSFGIIPTWEYMGVGQYDLVFPLNTLVNENNVWIYSDIRGGEMNVFVGGTPIDTQRIRFNVFVAGEQLDGWLYKAPFEIRYY